MTSNEESRPFVFRLYLACALLVIAAWMVVVYRHGEQTCILVHDCLDANVPTLSIFARSDAFFAGSDTVFQPLLGGLPRGSLPSETNLYFLPYRYLGALQAFIVSEFMMRVVALLGMALLLKRHCLARSSNLVICGAALCFAMLPLYPNVGLSIAGQPLLLYAILNLRNRNLAVHNWLIVGLFPFFSSLVMVGFFLIPLLALYIAYEALVRRKATVPLVFALLLLTGGYALAEYRLIGQMFAPKGMVSHRLEFAFHHQHSFNAAVKNGISHFLEGDSQTAAVQRPVIFLACFLAMATWLLRKRFRKAQPPQTAGSNALTAENGSSEAVAIALLCIACGAIALFFGLYDWTLTGRLINATGIRLLNAVQFQRIHWLDPLLWGLAFAFALGLLSKKSRVGIAFAVLLILLQASAAVRANYLMNSQLPLGGSNPQLRLTFAEFFSRPLFAEIKDYIGRPQTDYRVASLGMYPSIPFYSGFQTVDAYVSNFTLDYKHRFRKVIAGELDKDENLRNYFDRWGSRCYLFSHELGKKYLYVKNYSPRRVEQLTIDTAALRQLGCDYVLSAVEIGNAPELRLKLEKVFQRDDSPWQIYLYSIPSNSPLPQK
jgi:hypothetical protein